MVSMRSSEHNSTIMFEMEAELVICVCVEVKRKLDSHFKVEEDL